MRILIISVLLTCLGIQSARASECISFSGGVEGFLSIDLLFKGRALQTRTNSNGEEVTTFEVLETIKGREKERRSIIVWDISPTRFDNNEEYWVWARRATGGFPVQKSYSYWTSHCIAPPEHYHDMATAKSNVAKAISIFDSVKDETAKKKSAKELQASLNHADFLEFLSNYKKQYEEGKYGAGKKGSYTLFRLAMKVERWRDFEKQAWLLGLAAQAAPGDDLYRLKAAEVYIQIGDLDAAIGHLEEALLIDPGSMTGQDLLAKAILMKRGDFTRNQNDYRDVWLSDLTLSGRPGRGADFTGASFVRVNASKIVAHEAKFVRVQLTDVDFSDAHLEGGSFRGASEDGIESGSDFSRARMMRVNLDRAQLYSVRFSGADLRDAHAVGARFEGVDFVGANLTSMNFSGSSITYSNLSDASIGGANFDGVEFRGSNLTNIDFGDASTVGTTFENAFVNCQTVLPTGIDYVATGIVPVEPECNGVPQNRNFSNRPWWAQDFSELNLARADFSRARFAHSRFHGSNLRASNFRETSGQRYYAGADLTGADYTGAESVGDLTSRTDEGDLLGFPVLNGTIFDGATLSTSDFIQQIEPSPSYADLTTASFKNASLDCGLYTQWTIIDARIDDLGSGRSGQNLDNEALAAKLEDLNARKKSRQDLKQTERNLVRFIRVNWPSATLDKSCNKHLMEEPG